MALNERADLKPSPSARSNHFPAKSSQSIGPMSLATTTLELFQHDPSPMTELSSMPYLPDSHVRTSVLREVGLALRAHDLDCFSRLNASLANFDRASSSWKTSQRCLDGEWETFSEVWPRSGMMRNGTAYRLPTLVSDSFGTEFGLWPTPNATAFKGGRHSPRRGVNNPERNNWQDWCSLVLGQRYPVPEVSEMVMGYPTGHTEIEPSETP